MKIAKFTYQGRRYEYDLEKMHSSEGIAIEHHTGMTPRAFYDGLSELKIGSLRALILLGLRRAGEPVKWDNIEFDVFEFAEDFDMPDEESVPPTPPTGTPQWPGESDTSDPSPTT